MSELLDAFWRALLDALHPAVLIGSLVPLLAAGGIVFALGWFGWEEAVGGVRMALDDWGLVEVAFGWLDAVGAGTLRTALAPLIVVALAIPLLVVVALLLVAVTMSPALVRRVVARRFATLEAHGGAGAAWRALLWSLAQTLLALLALVVTLPLWLIPPLALVLPALIWGWLAARVLAFEVLSAHASPDERHAIMQRRRAPLLAMGVASGLLGALPSLAWALGGVAAVVFAPVLAVVAVWLYTLVFAFATLWFAHYALACLHALRAGTLSSAP